MKEKLWILIMAFKLLLIRLNGVDHDKLLPGGGEKVLNKQSQV